jgi:hypothetical protein
MTETNETHNVTNLPTPKQKKLQNPFAKKNDTVPSDGTNETTPDKGNVLNGAAKIGVALLAGGLLAAAVSKLAKKADDEVEEVPTDITDSPES